YINGFGENDVAAFTVYFKVENLIYLPIMAFGQTMVTFTGQNIGAGQMKRVKKGAVQCNLFSVAVIGMISAAVLLNGREILTARWHTIQAVAAVYPISWFFTAVLFVVCWLYYKNKAS
ncbi:MAG: MATE family efflux transporter, partial [Lachnospiraceae bacterium]|nr:MATE family efflux transporter [Lachnospiraceae bacterium]